MHLSARCAVDITRKVDLTMMKKLLSILCTLVILLSVSFGVASAKEELVLTDEQLAALQQALEDETKELPVGDEFRIRVDSNDLSVAEGLDKDWLHILILGTDTGSLELNYGRTDAMMVASVNTKTGQMKLTSLVRDMLVDIPGLSIRNRINTANAFGGPLLAVKTVNEVLGLNITRYCSINFRGFKDIVDLLGGVTLTLSGGESAEANAPYSNGPQVLNGEQALAYVRIRKLDNNFGRNQRQRLFLNALLEQVKNSSMDRILSVIAETFKIIATNLTPNEVIALLPPVLKNAEGMEMLSLPQEGTFKYTTTSWGASVVDYDAEAVKKAFHAFVYGAADVTTTTAP